MIREHSLASRLFDTANFLFLLLFGLLCLLPLVHVVAVSFSHRAASMGGFVTLWPVGFTTQNYQEILKAGPVYQAFLVSVQRTVLGTLLNMTMTVLAAYPLSKTSRELRGRDVLMWIFLFAMLFSGGL
ncbi:MAG: ABC transporter permease, partial [Chloroflexi bacterium]